MPFKVTNALYDLQGKTLQIAMSDGALFVNVNGPLHVPPDTPEHQLKQKMEEQARQVLREAANFVSEHSSL